VTRQLGVAADPTEPGTVYLALQGGGDPTFQGRILASTDAGKQLDDAAVPDIACTI